MHYQKYLSLIFLFPAIVFATTPPPEVVVSVFTTKNYEIKRGELAHHIYFLDAVEELEEQTTRFLSKKPELAEEQAKKWLFSEGGKQFEQQLQRAYIGITEGWKLGIMKVPAILFQSKGKVDSVIYGQKDVAKAIEMYQKFEE